MEFLYEARTRENEVLRGNVSAESPRDAARRLQEQGLFALRIFPASGRTMRIKLFFRKRHSKFAMGFFRQLSVMLKSGFSLSEALTALHRQEGSAGEKAVLSDVCRTVRSGGALSSALESHPLWFPESAATIVRAGEMSGALEEILTKLASGMRKQYIMKEKRMTLLAYPAILLTVSVLAAAFLLTFVFPMFVQFFSEMHASLPLPTRAVLFLYDAFREYGAFLFSGLMLIFAECAFLYRKERVRRRADGMMLRVPLIGRLVLQQELSKIAGTLAVLLESGMVLNEALYITAGITGNACLSAAADRAGRDVEKGFTVSSSFEKADIFPEMFMSHLRTGETAGAMTEILSGLEAFYAEESDELAQRMQALLEPCMVLFAGAVIGTLVFAIALPVLDMMTSFGG